MPRSIIRNANAIAAAVTTIVIEGQWFSRKCLADIRCYSLAPKTSVVGSRELRKLSHVRRVVRHSNFELPMSALGQKPTYAVQKVMSALALIATAKADFSNRSCVLYPQKRTYAAQQLISALGQKRCCAHI